LAGGDYFFSFLNDALFKMQVGFVVIASYSRGWLVSRRFSIERNPHVSVGMWGYFFALDDEGFALAALTIKQPNSHL
jgi:hypothetical protein